MKRNDIIFLLVSSVIVTIAWIVFSVIHAATSSTISPDLGQAIEPINPSFDTQVITNLRSREKIAPVFTNTVQTSPTPTPTPSTPTPTISVSLTPAPIATQGGTPL